MEYQNEQLSPTFNAEKGVKYFFFFNPKRACFVFYMYTTIISKQTYGHLFYLFCK